MSTIVQRVTWHVREGHTEQEALKANEGMMAVGLEPARIYTSMVGCPQSDTLIFEFEFEDLAAMQAYWQRFFAKPEVRPPYAAWLEVCYPMHSTEIWERAV